ncbi:MAG: hypothetical protein AM1032_000345 [Mycoplasmataceae bacterium]|nr:MAG: hypothetical protein AM1032_000345 [Mycoplasmataceae bacterium]
MTWTWTLTKIGVGIGLSLISSNPVGWAIGLPTSELIKFKNKENLNSSTLTFSDKEEAQRWIEISNDYQIGAGLGIVGKGLGSVISSSTLKLGKDASKEIAVNGFRTELARSLITKGQSLSKLNSIIKNTPNLYELEKTLKGFNEFIKKSLPNSNVEDFIESANILIQSQNLFITEIQNDLIEKRNLLNTIKKNILELNKKNIEFFIKYEKNREEHRRINSEINTILTIIKGLQKKLHTEGECCDECRFCKGGN